MRTLVVDGLRLRGKRTAMGRYIERLTEEWSCASGPFDKIVVLVRGKVELKSAGTATPVEVRSFGEWLPPVVWQQVGVAAQAERAALLFSPSYAAPIMYPHRLVVANHGIYARIPESFPLIRRLGSTPVHRLSAVRATRVIANSNQTKNDLVTFYKVPTERIVVVYPAAAAVFFERHDAGDVAECVERTLGSSDPYLMFVGKLSLRRNVPNLIRAFGRVRQAEDLPHKLLIVGPNTSELPLGAIAEEAGVSHDVIYIPHLEQDVLARLYAGATAFVLPTTYEGISHTMFEAMASGTPVLTVEHPTIDEGQQAAYTIRSPGVDDIAAGIRTLLADERLRSTLSERGRAQAGRFSWKRAAAETASILDRVARPSDRGRLAPFNRPRR